MLGCPTPVRRPTLTRPRRQAAIAPCCTVSGWRVERRRILGLNLPPARFALAPTDGCAPGSCIAWALFFSTCPPADRVEAALGALLSAYPFLAARPCQGNRYEVELTPGACGLAFEHSAWEGVTLDEVLEHRLGFSDAHLAFDKPPREQLPFLCLPDHAAMEARKEGLVGARLTRLDDGAGVLAVTFSHSLTDGQRCVTLLSALAAACRGEELQHGMTHDRSVLWPQALAAHPAVASILGHKASQDAPPPADAEPEDDVQCVPPDPPPPPGSWSLLPLHVPSASLSQLAASLAPLAPELRLSSHDVLAGLVWSLRCALAGVSRPGEHCSGRFIVALDLSANGLPQGVLPQDFTGNCAAALSVCAKTIPSQNAADKHLQAVAQAAGAVRTAVAAYRADPLNAINHLLSCGGGRSGPAASGGRWQQATSTIPLVGYATSCLRVPTDALDCGTGPPVALHYSTLPLRSSSGLLFASLAPAPRGDGALVLLAASDTHARVLTASTGEAAELLRATVPAARWLR